MTETSLKSESDTVAGTAPEIVSLPGGFDLRALHSLNPARYPFLLQSTAISERFGRYDILFAFPGDSLVMAEPNKLAGDYAVSGDQFLPALDAIWSAERLPEHHSDLPFTGGWFLYLGYELAAEVEPGLRLSADTIMPSALAVRCPAAIIFDHVDSRHFAVKEASSDIDLKLIDQDISACTGYSHSTVTNQTAGPTVEEEQEANFLAAVEVAKVHIARGDIYQANLSRRWSARLDGHPDPMKIYEALCLANPGPFAGLVHWQGASIISSSPERLLKVRNGVASTRPIAGTRPRSADKNNDDRLSAELITHPKERAEHVMLIDLERNDLGRICEPGTIEVDEMMVLESYAHVHHIVSNVNGKLRGDVSPGDCIRAVFPGGTITGCPKVRCMEIIAELEEGARGAYTGSFGYLNRDGSLDLNILIRTMVMRDDQISLRAGSGIVADSQARDELAETRAKAKGLIRALSQ